MPALSIIVVTYNRSQLLLDTLHSIQAQSTIQPEILVVDNASTDDTYNSLKTAGLSNLRVLRLAEQEEIASCKNMALEMATGDGIGFTDDDCIVGDRWPDRLVQALQRSDAVGGPVVPFGQVHYPNWWSEELNWLIGISVPEHFTQLAGTMVPPWGSNMAFQALVIKQEKFQVLDVKDPKPYREDNELWMRLRAKKYRLDFVTDLIVYHRVPADRLKLSYCLRRAFWDGFYECLRFHDRISFRRKWQHLINSTLLGGILQVPNPKATARALILAAQDLGYVLCYFRDRFSYRELRYSRE